MYDLFKSLIDFTISIILIALFSPIILIVAIVIKISSDGPVIYYQKRIGKNGNPFYIYKFRSMYINSDKEASLLAVKEDKRITKVGRLIRRHRIDEIPNFINVLKGEMSLVGPRPEQQYFIDQAIARVPDYKLLLEVKPGIISWGNIKYGYASNIDEIIERHIYDLYYLKKKSLWFDFKILLFTIPVLLLGK